MDSRGNCQTQGRDDAARKFELEEGFQGNWKHCAQLQLQNPRNKAMGQVTRGRRSTAAAWRPTQWHRGSLLAALWLRPGRGTGCHLHQRPSVWNKLSCVVRVWHLLPCNLCANHTRLSSLHSMSHLPELRINALSCEMLTVASSKPVRASAGM